MLAFVSIKELIAAFRREERLFTEMFEKRKTFSFKYDTALEFVDFNEDRLHFLIQHSVLRQNGNYLEIDDTFLQFFEHVLEVNEEINTHTIDDYISSIRQNIIYFEQEFSEKRKYEYLRKVKSLLRKIGSVTLRNVVDLKRNVDNTFKNEPNYRIKKSKLENLDEKRVLISSFIEKIYHTVSEEHRVFFYELFDEELKRVLTHLKHQLNESRHNLIDIQKEIIEYLNQIKYQSSIIEKLRQLKYLRDQFTIRATTNIDHVLNELKDLVYETHPTYPLKLSLEFLQTDSEAYNSILRVAERIENLIKFKVPVAGKVDGSYLDLGVEEEIHVDLERVKNNFLKSKKNLFEFLLAEEFEKEVKLDERITMYCQIVSLYGNEFNYTGVYATTQDVEFAVILPN